MPFVPNVATAFSPLDEELQLLPGQLTPHLHEQLVRVSTWMPFPRAVREFEWFTHVPVPESLARRLTEAAGAAHVELETAAVTHLEQTQPVPPEGPAIQLLSPDGAMVPLVGGEWGEVKTLVIGTVHPPTCEKGEMVVQTTDLSYFSRLADAEEFGRLSLVEVHRRGVERAQQVCAVSDGALWAQGLIDLHRADAMRILDFPHAAEHVTQAGAVVHGEDTPALHTWVEAQLHELKHGSPDRVLAHLQQLYQDATQRGLAQAEVIQKSWEYLQKRRAQIAYADFQAQGYPIGSGVVESGNKLVVEVRLKGAGMHWARQHVNPMLALRNIVCNDRWDAAWPQIEQHHRQQDRTRREARRQQRRLKQQLVTAIPQSSRPADARPASVTTKRSAAVASRPRNPAGKAHPPADNHPWRHMPVGRAVFLPRKKRSSAKS